LLTFADFLQKRTIFRPTKADRKRANPTEFGFFFLRNRKKREKASQGSEKAQDTTRKIRAIPPAEKSKIVEKKESLR